MITEAASTWPIQWMFHEWIPLTKVTRHVDMKNDDIILHFCVALKRSWKHSPIDLGKWCWWGNIVIMKFIKWSPKMPSIITHMLWILMESLTYSLTIWIHHTLCLLKVSKNFAFAIKCHIQTSSIFCEREHNVIKRIARLLFKSVPWSFHPLFILMRKLQQRRKSNSLRQIIALQSNLQWILGKKQEWINVNKNPPSNADIKVKIKFQWKWCSEEALLDMMNTVSLMNVRSPIELLFAEAAWKWALVNKKYERVREWCAFEFCPYFYDIFTRELTLSVAIKKLLCHKEEIQT